MEQIMDALNMLFVTVVTGIIGIVGTYITIFFKNLTAKVKASTSSIKDEKQRALVDSAINRLDQIIYTTVYSTQLTLVEKIKAASADGKLTKDECSGIKQTVICEVKNQISDEIQGLVIEEITDIDTYISNKIETELSRIKNEL